MEVETTKTLTATPASKSNTEATSYTPEELQTLFGTESVAALEKQILAISAAAAGDFEKRITAGTLKGEKAVTKLMNTLTSEGAKDALAGYLFQSATTSPEAKEAIIVRHLGHLQALGPGAVYEAAKASVFPYIAKSRVLKALVQLLDHAEETQPLCAQLELCRDMLGWADPDLFARRRAAEKARLRGSGNDGGSAEDKKKSKKAKAGEGEESGTEGKRAATSFIVYRLELRECAILYGLGLTGSAAARCRRDGDAIFASCDDDDDDDNGATAMVVEGQSSGSSSGGGGAALEEGLRLTEALVSELKIIDERTILVEAQLLECKFQYALRNAGRAKAALTAARTGAMAMYCPQGLQADLDMEGGVLSADERDFRTAFSYFFEAFEGYVATKAFARAENALAALLLCKVMSGHYDDTAGVINAASKNKSTASAAGAFFLRLDGNPKVRCMLDVARACKERSLSAFLGVLRSEAYAPFLVDPVTGAGKKKKEEEKKKKEHATFDVAFAVFLRNHFGALYNTLVEKNIARIIEPFSCVEVAHVARIIDLPPDMVERKISQMILDGAISGILDQNAGTLIIFEDAGASTAAAPKYECTLDIIHGLDKVVDSLYTLASKQ